MSFIENVAARFGYVSAKDLAGWENIVNSGPEWWRQLWQPMPRYSIEQMIGQYKNWVYACATARADAVAKLDQILLAQKGQEEPVEVEHHPWINVMRQPNPITSRYDLWFNTIMFQDLVGNAPWLIIPNSLMVPEQIWNLLPQNLRMAWDSERKNWHWEYWQNGKKMIIPKELLVLHKYPSPVSLIWGYSPVEAVGDSINIDHASDTYEWNKLDNGMIPPFVFTQPTSGGFSTMSPEVNSFTERWKKSHSKILKGHLPGVLPPGWGTEIITDKLDASRPELVKMAMQKVLAGYRTSLAVLGLTTDANRASAEAVINFWLKNTVMPLTMRIEETIENQILNNPIFYPGARKQGVWFDLDFEYPDMQDKEFELRVFEATKQALTVNEWRDQAGKDDIGKTGDVILVPLNLIPLNVASQPPEAPPQIEEDQEPKMLTKVTGQSQVSAWRRFARITQAWEKLYIRELHRFFKKQEVEVLGNLKDAVPKAQGAIAGMAKDKARSWLAKQNVYEQVIFNLDDAISGMAEDMTSITRTIFWDSGEAALEDMVPDLPYDQDSDDSAQYIGQKMELMSEEVNQTTQTQLTNELREGFEQGEGINELSARVSSVYSDAAGYRARMIARTEVIAASNAGALDGYAQSGLNPKKEWLAALDERTRDSHINADGQRVPLNSTFSVNGSQMLYPGDPAGGAAETVNCRCTIIPIVEE